METQNQTQINLHQVAPAVYSYIPDSKVSDKYTFVRTADILEKLNDAGWHVVDAKQVGRKKTSTARHMVTLENPDYSRNGVCARIFLHNSHNRTRSFKIGIGFFIAVCSNGVMVMEKDGMSEAFQTKHINVTMDNIGEIIAETIQKFEVQYERINQFQQIELTSSEKMELASKAIDLRWKKGKDEIAPEKLLDVRHEEQNSNSLWDVFNVIQENLMQGGIEYKTQKGRNMTTRKVKGLQTDVYLNENLWMLMEGLRISKI